jgi:hypothetical protein
MCWHDFSEIIERKVTKYNSLTSKLVLAYLFALYVFYFFRRILPTPFNYSRMSIKSARANEAGLTNGALLTVFDEKSAHIFVNRNASRQRSPQHDACP